jgi:hypothetical protein
MENLPNELLIDIFARLPAANRKTARLTCRMFNWIIIKDQFGHLATFIDPEKSLAICEAAGNDLSTRPRSVWSPRCSVPEQLPIPESFLLALYAGLARQQWEADDTACHEMTVTSMASKLGRGDITDAIVRQALFRYALYLSYNRQLDGSSSYGWVFSRAFTAPRCIMSSQRLAPPS